MLVKELIGKGEPGTLEWQGQTLEFVYNPNAISYRERKSLRRMVLAQEQDPEDPETDWLILYVTRMVKSWELYLTEADKKAKHAVPIQRESLDELPSAFLLALVSRLGELVSPPVPAVIDSGGSFSAGAVTNGASVPTGTSTF